MFTNRSFGEEKGGSWRAGKEHLVNFIKRQDQPFPLSLGAYLILNKWERQTEALVEYAFGMRLTIACAFSSSFPPPPSSEYFPQHILINFGLELSPELEFSISKRRRSWIPNGEACHEEMLPQFMTRSKWKLWDLLDYRESNFRDMSGIWTGNKLPWSWHDRKVSMNFSIAALPDSFLRVKSLSF